MHVREFVGGGTVLFAPIPSNREDRSAERSIVLSQFFRNYKVAREHAFPYCITTAQFSSWMFVWTHEDIKVRAGLFDVWRDHAMARDYWTWVAVRDYVSQGAASVAGDAALLYSPARGLHDISYIQHPEDHAYSLRISTYVAAVELPPDFIERMFLSDCATGSPAALLKSLW